MSKRDENDYISRMFFHISEVERLVRETKNKVNEVDEEEVIHVLENYGSSIAELGCNIMNIEKEYKSQSLGFPYMGVSATSNIGLDSGVINGWQIESGEHSDHLLEQVNREKMFRKLIEEYAPKPLDVPVLKKRY